MNSILSKLATLRAGRPLIIDYHNTNRYRILARENDGTKTAAYFSAPIYQKETRKLIDPVFQSHTRGVTACGSNAKIIISDLIDMENKEGHCRLNLSSSFVPISNRELSCGSGRLYPTTNGVAYLANVKQGPARFTVQVTSPFWTVRANDRCFALMQEDFCPFVSISAIGTATAQKEIIAPARIDYQKLTDLTYALTLTPLSPMGSYVLLEANLYEPKLFQDTTVESMQPQTNNAYGTVAFVGQTAVYGEQWLYSRLDHTLMTELSGRRIKKAVLHFPRLGGDHAPLQAYRTQMRFCSFGSNWKNKVGAAAALNISTGSQGYHSLDITTLISDPTTGFYRPSDGLILRAGTKGSGFSAVATGDSCFAPQILEVNFQ